MRNRASAGIIGLIYLFVSYKAFRILTAETGAGSSEQQQADTVLDLPGGEIVLGAVALFIIGAGVMQLIKAAKSSFLRNLDAEAMSDAVKWLGRIGYAARGIIFLCVGWLLGRAALDGRSDEAGGMERALDLLSGPALFAVAGGLMLFGLFSMVEARYRRIHRPPPPEQMAAEIRDKVPG